MLDIPAQHHELARLLLALLICGGMVAVGVIAFRVFCDWLGTRGGR